MPTKKQKQKGIADHSYPMNPRKRIALIAHDHRKNDLIDWAEFNQEELAQHKLFGTGTTGKLISEELDLPVHRFKSGPLGGDLQMGASIAKLDIDIMIFFWDPLQPQPHDVDVKALLRIAVVYNIPIAQNRSTADFLISSDLFNESYDRFLTDYSKRFSKDI